MRSLRAPLIGGLAGGLVVALLFALVGSGGSGPTRTVYQQQPLSGLRPTSDQGSGALTAREIYKRVAPGVVQIRAQIVQQVQSPFGFGVPDQQQATSTGSGFVIDKDGYVLTNAHVVEGAADVTVQFEDKQTKSAKVVGKDVSNDLALLKVDPAGLSMVPLELGDSSTAQVGDPVVAIGNPFGLDRTLTTGVVSAIQRQIPAPNNFSITHVIQTDAPINPGNSGGPLLDSSGRVIGVTSQIKTADGSASGGNIGIGFAEPINTAKQVIPQLKKNGQVAHAYLGIEGAGLDASLTRLNLPPSGVLVEQVVPDGPAARAGIRGGDATTTVQMNGLQLRLGGDVITNLDGKPVASMDDLISIIGDHKPGDQLKVDLLRNGKPVTIQATLGNRPTAAAQ